MKIVINTCLGGFGLNHKAIMRYAELKKIKLYPFLGDMTKEVYQVQTVAEYHKQYPNEAVNYVTVPIEKYKKLQAEDEKNQKYTESSKVFFSEYNIDRTDLVLIKVVKELGQQANATHADLEIIEIPDGVEYEIDEYDGIETIHEKHRSWE